MKYVIDIDEDYYKAIKNILFSRSSNCADIIKMGTPLEEVLEDIKSEIQSLRGCSCGWSDGIIDDVEDIIDKHISGKE